MFGTSTSSPRCTMCPAGTFKYYVGDGTTTQVCRPCPANSYTNGVGARSCRCAVGAGVDAKLGGLCSICPNGFFKGNVSDDACASCPANSDTNGTSGSWDLSQCSCLEGTEGTANLGSGCQVCGLGRYKARGNGNCQQCPANALTTNKNSASRSSCFCVEGYSGDARTGECTICPKGTYKSSGNSECVACPLLSTTSVYASVFIQQCLCIPGFSFNQTTQGTNSQCAPCGVGLFKDSTNNTSCDVCPFPGELSTLSSSAISADECLCIPGFGLEGSRCQKCKPAYYKDTLKNERCTRCPEDLFPLYKEQLSTSVGSTSFYDCCPSNPEGRSQCDGYITDMGSKLPPKSSSNLVFIIAGSVGACVVTLVILAIVAMKKGYIKAIPKFPFASQSNAINGRSVAARPPSFMHAGMSNTFLSPGTTMGPATMAHRVY